MFLPTFQLGVPSSRRRRSRFLVYFLLVLVAYVSLGPAIAIHPQPAHDSNLLAHRSITPFSFTSPNLSPRNNETQVIHPNTNAPGDCTFAGDADLYGVGVRLGVYFQWVTSFLANVFCPEEISSALDQNAIFLFAILIATLKTTLNHSLRLLDALILLEISFGYFFSVLSLFGWRTRMYGKTHLSLVGTYIRMFLAACTSGYAAWFWVDGITWLNTINPGPCDPIMFMFAKVRVFGWMRWVWRVLAIICATYFCFLFIAGMVSALLWMLVWCYDSLVKRDDGFKAEWIRFWKNEQDPDAGSVVDPKKARRAFIVLSVFNIAFIPWSIVNIEFTLNWNHMTGVTGTAGMHATGQLIPALIGLASCARILWIVVMQAIEKYDKKKGKPCEVEDGASSGEQHGEPDEKKPRFEQRASYNSIEAAQNKTFKMNGEILINLLSFGFIKRKKRDEGSKKGLADDGADQQPADPLWEGTTNTAAAAEGEGTDVAGGAKSAGATIKITPAS